MPITLGVGNTVTYYMRNANGAPVPSMTNQTVKLSKNGATPATPANDPVEVGNGLYSLALTATECNAAGVIDITSVQGSYYGQKQCEVAAHEPAPNVVNVLQYHTAQWLIPIRLTLPDGSPARNAIAGGGVTMTSAINGSAFASISPVQLAEFGSDSEGWYYFDTAANAATYLCSDIGQRIVKVQSIGNPLARGSVLINVV